MEFAYPEDAAFFRDLLWQDDQQLDRFRTLFDFRPPVVKRREFNQKREQILAQLLRQYGSVCQLQISNDCDIGSGSTIDHLIPLSSNKLNKELRHLKARPGKKVASQSFGSNHPDNLVIACGKCNGLKKHRFLAREQFRRIFGSRGL